MRYIRIILLLTVVLLALLYLFYTQISTTYYVDSDGGNDANAGTSEEEPWQSLDNVNDTFFWPGDRILFKRGGSWSGTWVGLHITSSGIIGKPITFSHYGNEDDPLPSFQATDLYGRAVWIHSDWVVIDGLRVIDTSYAGFALGDDTSDTVYSADNNRIQNSQAENVAIGALLSRGRGNTIQNNLLRDLTLFPSQETPGPDDDFGAMGFLIQDSDNIFSENTCINCKDTSPDYGEDGSGFEFYAQYHDITDIVIRNNTIITTDNAIEVGGRALGEDGDYTPQYTVSARVHHNVFVDSKGLHFNLGNYQYAVDVTGFQIHNNTFVRTSTAHDTIVNTTHGQLTGSQLELANNIVYGYLRIAQDRNATDHVNFDRSHNLYYHLHTSQLPYLTFSEIVLQPQPNDTFEIEHESFFTNMKEEDYQLRAKNKAIDAGADLGYDTDRAGTAIPQGAAPDIGAYEYVFPPMSHVPSAILVPCDTILVLTRQTHPAVQHDPARLHRRPLFEC